MRRRTALRKFGVIGVALLLLGLAALTGVLLRNTRLLDPFRYQFSAEPLRLGMAETIDNIPYVETREYLEKVNTDYQMYVRLYSDPSHPKAFKPLK